MTDWVWPGWLAAGHVHVFDGDPGVGKSMLIVDLAARLSSGRPWPDGAAAGGPASVILLNAEDDAATTRSRLAAAEADMSRVVVWSPGLGESAPHLPDHIDPLAAAAERCCPRLIVLDPFPAFLGRSVNFNSDPGIRRALAPLAALAAQARCAVLLIRHLSKRPGGRPLYRGLGSIGLIAACRIAWFAALDPKNPDQSILAASKNNLHKAPGSLAFAIRCGETPPSILEPHRTTTPATSDSQPAVVSPEAAEILGPVAQPATEEPPRVVWLGSTSAVASDLLAASTAANLARRRAGRFLAELLAKAPLPATAIADAARPQQLAMRTLRRAARDVGITFKKIGNQIIGQTVYWLMPGQRVPKEAYHPDGIDEWLDRLDAQQEQFRNLRNRKAAQ